MLPGEGVAASLSLRPVIEAACHLQLLLGTGSAAVGRRFAAPAASCAPQTALAGQQVPPPSTHALLAEIEGLLRKLTTLLAPRAENLLPNWRVADLLGTYYRRALAAAAAALQQGHTPVCHTLQATTLPLLAPPACLTHTWPPPHPARHVQAQLRELDVPILPAPRPAAQGGQAPLPARPPRALLLCGP